MNVISLEEVKQHLKYDDNSNDDVLNGYILAVEEFILSYLNNSKINISSNTAIKQAALLIVGYWDSNRNGDINMSMPPAAMALLNVYKTPVIT